MTLRTSATRPKTRWALLIGAIAGGLLLIAGVALADPPNHENFQLDGNIAQDATTPVTYDWQNMFGTSGENLTPPANYSDQVFVPDFLTTTNNKGATVFDTSDPSTFTIGSKDTLDISQWYCTAANNVTDKGDIMNAYAVMYTDPVSHHKFMYFALERNANTGDANVAFWFLTGSATCSTASGTSAWSGNHQNGDLLVVSAFTKGGTVSTINAYEWQGGATGSLNPTPVASGGDCRDNTQTYDTTCATANESAVTTPWLTENKTDGVGHTLQPGEFFEGGIDLTNAGFTDVCFTTFIADTRSSQSLTATLYDYALGTLPGCTSQTVTSPSVTGSTMIPASGTLSVTDDAAITVAGVDSFNGSVSFHLCGPYDASSSTLCSSGGVVAGTQPVTSSPSTVTSNAMTITEVGRYCWRADFSSTTQGVPPSSDSSASECFTVTPRQSTLSTAAGAGPVDFGQPVTDTATLGNTANHQGSGGSGTDGSINPATAGGAAGGSITFTLYGPDPTSGTDCSTVATGTGTNPQTVSVSGDGPYGPVSFTPDSPGVYHWVASYSGDLPNTLASTHNTSCNDTGEDVTVRQLLTDTVTGPVDGSGTPITDPVIKGGSVYDLAIVTDQTAGGGDPTGTVDFYICNPGAVTGTGASAHCASGDGTLVNSVTPLTAGPGSDQSQATSSAVTASDVGVWCFRATYTPDTTKFVGSSDNSNDECFTVVDVTMTTAQTFTVKDAATVVATGPGATVGGTVEFQLFAGSVCSGSSLTDQTVTVPGGSASQTVETSPVTITTSQPTLSWLVTYTPGAGATNKAVTSSCGTENASLTINNGS